MVERTPHVDHAKSSRNREERRYRGVRFPNKDRVYTSYGCPLGVTPGRVEAEGAAQARLRRRSGDEFRLIRCPK
jgi:hypothetical protein